MVPLCVSQKNISVGFVVKLLNEWGWGWVDGSVVIHEMWSLPRDHSSMQAGCCAQGRWWSQGRQVSAFEGLTDRWWWERSPPQHPSGCLWLNLKGNHQPVDSRWNLSITWCKGCISIHEAKTSLNEHLLKHVIWISNVILKDVFWGKKWSNSQINNNSNDNDKLVAKWKASQVLSMDTVYKNYSNWLILTIILCLRYCCHPRLHNLYQERADSQASRFQSLRG